MQSLLSVNTNLSLFSVTIAPSTFLATVTLCLVFLALYLPPLRPFFGGSPESRSSSSSSSSKSKSNLRARRPSYRDYDYYYNDYDDDYYSDYHHPGLPAKQQRQHQPNATTITNRLTSYLSAWAKYPAPIELRDHPPLIEGLPRPRTTTTTSRWTLTSKPNKDRRIALRTSTTSSKKDARARIESEKQPRHSSPDALRPGPRRRLAALFGRPGRTTPSQQQQQQHQQQPLSLSLRLPAQHNDKRLSPPTRRQHHPSPSSSSPQQQQYGQSKWWGWGWLLAPSVAPPRQRRQIERVLAQGRG